MAANDEGAISTEGATVGEDGSLFHLRISSRSVGPRPTYASRVERGLALRRAVPRESHAVFAPGADRQSPVDLLEGQARTRVEELVPIRYGRMMASPFAFYRGAALIMASDLATTPRTGVTVQACGDAHLSNFGAFASLERRLVFDINDFDETLPGPWEWDVKRLATSFQIAAEHNGLRRRDQDAIVLRSVSSYREAMRRFAKRRNLEVWYDLTEVQSIVDRFWDEAGKRGRRNLDRHVRKALRRDSLHAFNKLAEHVGDSARIESDPPLLVPIREFEPGPRDQFVARIGEVLAAYRRTLQHDRRLLLDQYRLVDIARKVVGVGSVGTDAWIALFIGHDWSDPLFLQMKEAQPSVLEGFAGRSRFRNHGERVVAGQRCTQATGDIFLGWMRVRDTMAGHSRDYYVRQLRDWKGGVIPELMRTKQLLIYATVCGETLARAHARTGDRVALATYLGGGPAFDQAVLGFARAYAEQNQRDYAELASAIAAGRLAAHL